MHAKTKLDLAQLLSVSDKKINLAEAALMVARLEYPQLDIPAYLSKIQNLADEISHRLPLSASVGDTLNQLNQVLFIEKGFGGNHDDYYDPRNSFLNDVMDRKLGIPISLSILYMQLGEALGLPLAGVSFPGHFLVKLDLDDGAIILDPYYGGISLSEEDLYERLQDFYGEKVKRGDTFALLESSSKQDIVTRIMRNLRNLYMHDGDWEKALLMADMMVEFDEDKADSIKSRAAIYDKLEHDMAALKDYKAYLKLKPNTVDNMKIRERIVQLSEGNKYLN